MSARRDAVAEALRVLAPLVPAFERAAILDHAEDSPSLRKASPQAAAWAALVAHVRHVHTDYDRLLDDGYDVESARHFVLDDINRLLAGWGCARRIGEGGSLRGSAQKDIDS